MAEAPGGDASPPPQRPFRALLRPPSDMRCNAGESALAEQLGARLRGAQQKAASSIVRRP
eukprot:7067356-Alexandrium_andersonii.AAC.1